MAFPLPKPRWLCVVPLVVGALLLGAPGFAGSAAADACHRYGSAHPDSISTQHAERAIICLLNKKRHSHGKPSLQASAKLADAANRHSNYMENHHCFDHVCGGEASIDSRLRSVGYLGGTLLRWSWGENIAWGEHSYGTPRRIVKAWMNSPEHRANILNGTFRDIGVGIVWGTPHRAHARGGIYTTDFGYRVVR
jgi:uncharacterized protein YkwD